MLGEGMLIGLGVAIGFVAGVVTTAAVWYYVSAEDEEEQRETTRG